MTHCGAQVPQLLYTISVCRPRADFTLARFLTFEATRSPDPARHRQGRPDYFAPNSKTKVLSPKTQDPSPKSESRKPKAKS